MTDEKPKRKQKIMKFLAISSIVISLVLSSFALYNSNELDDLKPGNDGETSLSRISSLYKRQGCENGGFSIQFGIDDNRDGTLGDEEVADIRTVSYTHLRAHET